jgi:hypothetical protein
MLGKEFLHYVKIPTQYEWKISCTCTIFERICLML